jgi:hypothetical protein
MSFTIGKTKDDQPVELSIKSMQRHFACFGSSGSGKTVACKVLVEEFGRNRVPVIAFDPQGDIASLAANADYDSLVEYGIDRELYDSFTDQTEVLIWTPGSSKGLPLCINPLQFEGIEKFNKEDQLRFLSATAKNIAGLLGYDLDTDDGKSVDSVLTEIFSYCIDNKIRLEKFKNLISILKNIPGDVHDNIELICTPKLIKDLQRKVSLLTTGSRRLIFETGTPANIDTLLGIDSDNGKTRISVIYLNTLSTQEEKEFFVSSITQLMYQWMLLHPLQGGQEGLQCLYYLDEIAPYIPPVKKPACKESLMTLFKQARKYGIGCLIATQNPGDIDYKAIAQFSTTNLGSLTQKQDLKKVQPRLESSITEDSDKIMSKLPGLAPGHFLLISPDYNNKVLEITTRRLITQHITLSEDKLKNYIDPELQAGFQKVTIDKPDASAEPTDIKEKQGTPADTDSQKPVNSVSTKKNKEMVFYMKNQIFERDIQDRVKPFLDGALFKSELLEKTVFNYLPLIRVELTFFSKKGLFRKKIKEIKEKLYLNYNDYTLFFLKDDVFQYSSVVDEDPHKIVDLDNIGEIESLEKDKIDYDFRRLGGKSINNKKIKALMERKYDVAVHSTNLILFPIWECQIKGKKSKIKRSLLLDGIQGKEIKK